MGESRLVDIEIDDAALPPRAPEAEQETRAAVFDLLESNSFELFQPPGRKAPKGPYALRIGIRDRRLVLDISANSKKAVEFHISLSPLRQVFRDYFQICDVYFDAVKRLPPSKIEAIDMARRGIHNEGALALQERLEGKIIVDKATARRLFTLVCALQPAWR